MDYELLKSIYSIQTFLGYTDEEIKELSEGFNEIPSSLYNFWRKCGNTRELFEYSNDPWINLSFLRTYNWVKKYQDYFFLLNENQGVYQAAIRRSDMSLDNPPVYIVEIDEDVNVSEVGQAETRLTDFLMGMLIYEAGLSVYEFSSEDLIWYEYKDIEKIEECLKKYTYHIYNWFSERIDLYTFAGDEILFIMQGEQPNGMYFARTEEAYKLIDDLIGNIGER